MRVRNIEEGKRVPSCGCKIWLQHWENNSHQKAGACSALGCSNQADLGGHVQKRYVGDDNWYIIPICTYCNNQRGEEYNVKTGTIFVPLSKTPNCGG